MKNKKVFIIIFIVLVFIGVLLLLVVNFLKKKNTSKVEVDVFPFYEYGGESTDFNYGSTNYGEVVSSSLQNVYISKSQKINHVIVKPGQRVKKGDVLLELDVKANQLAIDTKKAEVQLAKALLNVEESRLKGYKTLKPGDKKPEILEVNQEQQNPEVIAEATDSEPIEIPTYTKEEIDDLIKQSERSVKELKNAYDLQQISLEKLQLSSTDKGEVICTIDGIVKNVKNEKQEDYDDASIPYIEVVGDGGYTIESEIGEIQIDNISIGDQVSLMMLSTGLNSTGTITDIGTNPTRADNFGVLQSYYLIKISIDNQDVEIGSGCDISFSNNEAEGYPCVVSLFVDEDSKGSYVYKDNNGVLEKQYVETGKKYYGYYVEIKSGLNREDYLAYPLLRDAKEGQKTKRGLSLYEAIY